MAFFRLTKALLAPLQAEQLLSVAERKEHCALPPIDDCTFFFDIKSLINISQFWVQPTPDFEIKLCSDVIFSTPWHRTCYVSALATIGEGKKQGVWTQYPNHNVSVWLPWRIAFVKGGNHSIAAGILGGEGVVTATEVIDLSTSRIFDLVECDGKEYKHKETGEILSKVGDYRRAAVFEIGRMILKYSAATSSRNG